MHSQTYAQHTAKADAIYPLNGSCGIAACDDGLTRIDRGDEVSEEFECKRGSDDLGRFGLV